MSFRYRRMILIIMLIILAGGTVEAANPTSIKVGLVSIYNNVAEIKLSSDQSMEIGHYKESSFDKVGTLPSAKIIIKSGKDAYRDSGIHYSTYQEALEYALSHNGVPIYIREGKFGVYHKTTDKEAYVPPYVVLDDKSREVLLMNTESKEIFFRGYDDKSGQPLSQVGASKKYRGAIGIAIGKGLTPYNILDIEHYLYGVVPGEMSASWPLEALKAQAVAARSIAVYQYNRYTSYGYNVVDTTATQVYGGYTKEDARTNIAVDETRGQTINYKGKIAEALYFSTSGGVTESAVNVWGSPINYLVSVKDTYETEPAQPEWTRRITLQEVDKCLAHNGIQIGKAKGVQILSRTSSGRVNELKIKGDIGEYTLSMEKIRTFFSPTKDGSLKSRLFSFNTSQTTQSEKQKVTVLSATGKRQQEVDTLVVTNGKESLKPKDTLTILGANNARCEVQLKPIIEQTSESVFGDFIIKGKGYGHGVGMSQSGAKGMAKAGFNYVDILTHYYTGVNVG